MTDEVIADAADAALEVPEVTEAPAETGEPLEEEAAAEEAEVVDAQEEV